MPANPAGPQLPEPLVLRLDFTSDWHVGSGTGRPGHVDRLIVRDVDGLPYVPAKTLTGIWRDACERLVFGLDNGQAGAWTAWVSYLFGDQPARRETDPNRAPRPAVLSVRPARLPEPLRRRLSGDDQGARRLRAALTIIKPGVKIDRRSGRALDRHLRFEEMVGTGAMLTAPVALDLPQDADARAAAAALLMASTRLVERLGGKRRRGAGRCRLEIQGADIAGAIRWLRSRPTPPPVPATTPTASFAGPGASAGGEWVSISYELDLLGPLAVTSRAVGNVVESLDFVPGTCLLPHVTRALQQFGIDARPAIRSGDLRILPATIEIDRAPARAVPFGLFQHKEGGGLDKPATLVNRLVEGPDAQGRQLKQCRTGYLGPGGTARFPRHAAVEMCLRTHNTVDEESQRPTTDVGGVFSCQAIASPRLRGELRLRKDLADLLLGVPGWKQKLGGLCRLGRSRKDDYGAAELTVQDPGPPPAPYPCSGGKLFVWVLSDVLLRDERLRPAVDPDTLGRELEQRLGVHLRAADGLMDPPPFTRVRRCESWHTGWGLPRPSLVAIQAGSAVVFTLAGDPPTPAALARVEADGVGERTAEGFGQVRFNDPLLVRPASSWEKPNAPDKKPSRDASPLRSGDPAETFARAIEEEVWRREIRLTALGAAERRRDVLLWQDTRPNMSQLGGLRSIIARLRRWEDRSMAERWRAHLAENPRRRDGWPPGALERLRELLGDRDAVWRALAMPAVPTLMQGAETRLRTELWALAVRSLIDASIRAQKRELDRRQQPEG
jgi:CRISPR-associated protein Csx10